MSCGWFAEGGAPDPQTLPEVGIYIYIYMGMAMAMGIYICMAGAGGQLRVRLCTMYPPIGPYGIGPHGMVWDGIGASGCSCTPKVSFLSSLAHFSFCLSSLFPGRDEEGRVSHFAF